MKTFRLDRSRGKFLGVCAGLANATGLDANIIRISFVVMTLVSQTPWFCLAYFVLAWVAGKSGRNQRSGATEARRTHGSVHMARTELTETDRRLAEIERYTASPNVKLAREIDSLR